MDISSVGEIDVVHGRHVHRRGRPGLDGVAGGGVDQGGHVGRSVYREFELFVA